MLRGGVYGAAGPLAAVATATAAAILGPYCTGSRYGHVTAPARPSLLYAAGLVNERARPPHASCARARVAARIASRQSAVPRHAPALPPLSASPREHAREGEPTLTPTPKICLRKRNLIHPGRLIEQMPRARRRRGCRDLA